MSLFELRNSVFLGSYQSAINLAGSFHPESAQEALERDVLLYRAHAQQGDYEVVLNEIASSAPPSLLAVRLWAIYLSKKADLGMVLSTLETWQKEGTINDPIVQVIASLIYFQEHQLEQCFAALMPQRSLEASSILVQLYLSINRVDLASKEVQRMREKRDDAVPTQVARAWVNIESNKSGAEDALGTFQELKAKHGESVLILNGMASAHLHLGDYNNAEKALLQVLVLDKNSVATKINLYVCYQHQGKPKDKLAREFSQLLALAPKHPWVLQQQAGDKLFEDAASKFAPSK